jgi:hypothetical protein
MPSFCAAEDGVEVGSMLKVSRKRRWDARDDDAELFDDWSHKVRLEIDFCRFDYNSLL